MVNAFEADCSYQIPNCWNQITAYAVYVRVELDEIRGKELKS